MHKQFGNKEQIKAMISITSCNPVAVNHQVHRRASWSSQILEGSGRERKINKCFIFVYKGILYQLVVGHNIRGKVFFLENKN